MSTEIWPIEQMVRPRWLAARAGVTKMSVSRWVREGKIKAVKVNRTVMIPLSEVQRFLKEFQVVPVASAADCQARAANDNEVP